MVRSMTGYGRAEVITESYRAVCELKSVNHRYFEFSARVPRGCGFLEERLKSFLNGKISRGKLECYIQLESLGESDMLVTLNTMLLQSYLGAFRQLEQDFGVENDIEASSLLRVPDLFQVQKAPADEDAIWDAVRQAAEAALKAFLGMREAEGARLLADVQSRVAEILEHVAFVEERSPRTVLEYNEKLRERMRELLEGAAVEEQRLLTEAALFADKTAVAEETVRLRSHLQQLEQFLSGEEAIGRKLDFLVQEINREANTIGSKAQDLEITRRVVEMKSLVEKIREQVQNIE
ncbi:MAG: YicC family protein [Oscillospiraceae bacterium]|nr:YicC family protein [Oscillospiraceae bacterium]